jgi:hypothetical protein
MPIIAINISEKLILAIKELVERGLYQSFESFLEIAAFNQFALERSVSPTELLERGHRKIKQDEGDKESEACEVLVAKPTGKGDSNSRKQEKSAKRRGRTSTARRVARPVARMSAEEAAVSKVDFESALERLNRINRTDASPKPVPTSALAHSDDRIFGQVNRLFPMKLACRWLATASVTEGKWPKYDGISDRMADDAATVGSLLERWDNEAGRKRDDQLATGLPRRGNSSSRDRFLSQFVARVTRAGEIYPGAICQYGFAQFEGSAIVLSEQGLAFAEIDNPILDAKDSKSPAALSSAEADFLVHQVLTWVPSERDDMQNILVAVKEGKVTPPELISAVQSKFPRDWTENTVLTHNSGLVARLAELRLLRRQWQGRHVQYELGDKVEEFLNMSRTKERPE